MHIDIGGSLPGALISRILWINQGSVEYRWEAYSSLKFRRDRTGKVTFNIPICFRSALEPLR